MAPHTRPRRRPSGHTLLEVATALLLLTVLLGIGVQGGRTLVDRSAVASAREALVGLVARARVEATAGGGSVLHLRARPPGGWVEVAGDTLLRLSLADRGTELELPGGAEDWSLAFDPMGLGVVAAGTLSLRRGQAETRVVISGYARVRRR
mgnify:CR=1 FL=1